jgi:hypothetical protein
MADTKISGLTALTGANTASGDLLTIVDISDTAMAATGTNKKITLTELQSAPVSAGTANGVAYLNGSKVVTTGSALVFDGTNLLNDQSTASPIGLRLKNGSTSTSAGTRVSFEFGGSTTGYVGNQFDGSDFNNQYQANRHHIWLNGATEQMRLTSSGLTIGSTSNIGKLGVWSAANGDTLAAFRCSGTGTQRGLYISADNSTGVVSLDATGAAAGIMAFKYGGTEAMRIDTSGNLGIGTTSPGGNSSNRVVKATGSTSSQFQAASSATTISLYADASQGIVDVSGAYPLLFQTNSAERARIDSSGNLLVGKTAVTLGVNGFVAQPNGYSSCSLSGSTSATDTLNVYSTGASAYRFYVNMAGTIHATSTTITAISDQRLKENIRDLDDGLATVMALKPRKFDWKDGKGKGIKNDRGFIAQEFEQVLPDMISTWKDPAPEGEEPYKAVNANLIPTLVKAIQELKAEFDAYKATHP